MTRICRKANMVIYRSRLGRLADKGIPRKLGARFGLNRLDSNLLADDDSITSLEVVPGKSGRGYILYSEPPATVAHRRLLQPGRLPCPRVRAALRSAGRRRRRECAARSRDCLPPAARRQSGPRGALMAPDAMTIPPNTEAGAERPASVGPVFAIDSAGGNLHMRYTARTRSIVWKDDAATRAAVQALEQLLADGSPYVFRHRLAAGEGLLCNNVLHNRTAFVDDVDTGRAPAIISGAVSRPHCRHRPGRDF